jgi:hypothetical protein
VAQLLNLLSLAVVSRCPTEARPASGRKAHKPNPIPEVVAIIQGLRAKRLKVDMNALMRSEKLGIAEVGIRGGKRA